MVDKQRTSAGLDTAVADMIVNFQSEFIGAPPRGVVIKALLVNHFMRFDRLLLRKCNRANTIKALNLMHFAYNFN